jgi:endonuclease-3
MPNHRQQGLILDRLEKIYAGSRSALQYDSPFQLLVAVILSAQTNDNQVNRITATLFEQYPDAEAFAALTTEQLEPLINSCGLYKSKAKNIIATSKLLLEKFQGEVPQTKEELLSLPGVGGKTANVILSVAFGIPALAVDTHVFRVANRLGLAAAKTATQTEKALTALIPREKWADAHHWLIWHGRRICHARKPQCSICPLAELCPSRAEFSA